MMRGSGDRRRRRALGPACVGMLLCLLLAPGALAAVGVEVVSVPPRTAAGRPFEVNVSLTNEGPARDVYLFGAIYTREGGASGCGPATDPRFRGFTHMVQERIGLPASSVTAYPAPGDRWLHRYETRAAGAAPGLADLCIFVANATSGPRIEYESFTLTPLNVRARNAAPSVSFDEPARARAGDPASFEARAEDAEGDPLRFAWDFGHVTARGRAGAEGARVSHAFPLPGEYVVTLTASDGIDETRASRTIHVVAADATTPDRPTPGPSLAVLLLAALALARARRRH